VTDQYLSIPDLNRRKLLQFGMAMGATTAANALVSVQALAAGKAEVNLQLGWLANIGILGEVVAKRKGYFGEEGIELRITPGGPTVNGLASVASGTAQAGKAGSSSFVMFARSAGIPIKAFAVGYQKNPFTVFSLAGNPIRTPKDLIGKTIATQPTAVFLIKALLAKHRIAEKDVRVIKMGSDMSPLMTGQVDAVTGWQSNINALKIIGNDRVDLMLWDAAIQLYAHVYIANEEMLANHRDVLTRFLSGAARGWDFARQNPEAAVDHLVSEYSFLDRASNLAAVKLVLGYAFTDVTARDGWGAMSRANWQAQIDAYASLNLFKGKIPTVSDLMTEDILAATETLRKKIG
jgi:NitT/TauT family transport system substrate-binding protein